MTIILILILILDRHAVTDDGIHHTDDDLLGPSIKVSASPSSPVDSGDNLLLPDDEKAEAAAVKIQSQFRGFRVRKELSTSPAAH
jgi:hypothetical protein